MDQEYLFSEQKEADEFNNGKKRRKGRTPLTEFVSRKMLEDWYLNQKKSLEDVAKILGCTRSMVHHLMKNHEILRRKRSSARVLAIKNNKFERFKHDDIDEDFFSKWTPEMAWVLGLLFTDGNVQRSRGGLKVSISSIDYDLLDNVRYHLKSTRAIRKNPQSYDKSKFIYKFEFYREKMRDDLYALGLL